MRRSTFTLVELLVVMAIIAILAGILLPALSSAREKGKQANCVNNQRQLAVAFELYTSEWDGTFPWCTDGGSGAGRDGGWIWYDVFPAPTPGVFDPSRGTLYNYVKNTDVYRCPNDVTKNLVSYGMNGDVGARFDTGRPENRTSIPKPTETPLLIEEGTGTAESTNDGYFNIWFDPPDHIVNRHNKGSVFTYCDGHVLWERISDRTLYERCNFLDEPASPYWPAP